MTSMGAICLFVTAVGLVTVVGHAIWVVLALIFGGPRRGVEFVRAPNRCRNCKEKLPEFARNCPECGLTLDEAVEAADLRAAKRQLTAFHNTGLIDGDNFSRLTSLIRDRQRALSGKPTASPSTFPTSERRDEQERTTSSTPGEFPANAASPIPGSEIGSVPVVPPEAMSALGASDIADKAEDDCKLQIANCNLERQQPESVVPSSESPAPPAGALSPLPASGRGRADALSPLPVSGRGLGEGF
jgi:hypothetical protein